MKKIIIAAAIVCAVAFANAASVGWTNVNLGSYKGDAYGVFVLGQNGVTTMDAFVTDVLNAGKDWSSYAFGSGTVSTVGAASQLATTAGAPSLDAGTYQSFFVLFDSAAPKAGESKFAVVSGVASQTITIGAQAATATFASGNTGNAVASATWKDFGAAPEPTSGLLLILGVAGLALRRRHA